MTERTAEMPYTLEELQNIGKSSKTLYNKDKDGRVYAEKTTESSYYHEESATYSVLTKRAYIKSFKEFDISEVLGDKYEDIGRMTKIARNIKKDNMIMFNPGNKHASVPATRDSLCTMIGLSTKRGREFIDRMVDKGIISEWTETKKKITRYYLNPLYGMMGTEITLEVYCLFKEQLDPYLEPRAIKDLEKLLWIHNNHSFHIAMIRQADAEQELAFKMIRDSEDGIIDVDSAMEALEEDSQDDPYTEENMMLGYSIVRDGVQTVREDYGFKAKLHLTKDTVTVENLNYCKNALVYFFKGDNQDPEELAFLSKGFITVE